MVCLLNGSDEGNDNVQQKSALEIGGEGQQQE